MVTPEGKIVNILRVSTTEPGRDLAAIVNISDDGIKASFDPETGFIDLPEVQESSLSGMTRKVNGIGAFVI